ncbi:hypothetical protein E7T06_07290 [Deinococcus sp. Arct2-2]|uniref:hypothetical protein n=1 Tax=Deinococcus sp. Arct2-2 TaxID=2568653 RepID=UPI0010A4432B|nr:hypothetical protein [Deinococcus sp. Arct2-2]THF70501.1 hypothetical protein E7T06_07290 [Deinococcus sp. Arct2-2]
MTQPSQKGKQPLAPEDKPTVQSVVQPDQAVPTAAATHVPFEHLAAEQGVTGWRLPALRASAGWLPGQEVTAEEFTAAVEALDKEVIQ